MRRFGRAALIGTAAGAVAILSTFVTPVPAHAASVSQYGTVVFVDDGDTVDVDVDGDGTSTPRRIRFAGIQAMELHTYKADLALATGECHGIEATARLRRILGGRRVTGGVVLTSGARVRLTARDSRSSSRNRDERFVAVHAADGSWRDVGTTLIREGLALPQPHRTEYTQNRAYRVFARQAAAAHRGIWDTDSCGVRPAPAARVAVTVNWDAPGDDTKNPDGEYFKVANRGTSAVALGGWWVRDSGLRRYTFAKGTVLGPGTALYVHAGGGTTHRTSSGWHFYWGQAAPVFENVTGAPTYMGDGGYLFDPNGNLRAWQQYGRV
jgi:micrococcal nuclease